MKRHGAMRRDNPLRFHIGDRSRREKARAIRERLAVRGPVVTLPPASNGARVFPDSPMFDSLPKPRKPGILARLVQFFAGLFRSRAK